MSLGKIIAVTILIATMCYVAYMCILTSEQVQILVFTPHNFTGLIQHCVASTGGVVYPCRLCIPINTTALGYAPPYSTQNCRLVLNYGIYYTYRNVIDHITNITIDLPWTGLRHVVKSGGNGVVTVMDITVPGYAIYIPMLRKYRIGEYINKTGIKLVPIIVIPRYLPRLVHAEYGDSFTLSTNMDYIIEVPVQHVEISKILYGGYETTELNNFGFIVLVFTRYVSTPLDNFFQELGKTIGLSQTYTIRFPTSVLEIVTDDYVLNITVAVPEGNKTTYRYVRYVIEYTHSRCLTDICYVAYLDYVQYPSLVPAKVNGSGVAYLYARYVMINQEPTPYVELHGNSTSMAGSTPSVVIVKEIGNITDIGVEVGSAYMNVSKIPYTSRSLTYMFYIPNRTFTLHLEDLGRYIVETSRGKLQSAIGKSSTDLYTLLESLGIPDKYVAYIVEKIIDDIAWTYGKSANIVDVEVKDAHYVKTLITYSAKIYIPGDVDYVPIMIVYTCSRRVCELRLSIRPG